jgi:hypothetical protein
MFLNQAPYLLDQCPSDLVVFQQCSIELMFPLVVSGARKWLREWESNLPLDIMITSALGFLRKVFIRKISTA